MHELREAIKEAIRVSLMAAVPIVIDGLNKGGIDWRLITVATVIALLRFVDKWLHEWGKTHNEFAVKGLTRF